MSQQLESDITKRGSRRVFYNSRIKLDYENQMEYMKKEHFEKFKAEMCHEHNLPINSVSLSPDSPNQYRLVCVDCSDSPQNLVNVNHIVPKMCQWLQSEHSEIERENKKMYEQWNVASTNIQYCIDILSELLKLIHSHTEGKLYAPTALVELVSATFGMFVHDANNQSMASLVKTVKQLQEKFSFLSFGKYRNKEKSTRKEQQSVKFSCQRLQNEKEVQLKKATKAHKKSKEFSEKALAFTQDLTSLLRSKIKEEEIKSKLKKITEVNSANLKQIFDRLQKRSKESAFEEGFTEKIKDFTIEVPKSTKESDFDSSIEGLSKFQNLKVLRINNKNGKISHKTWFHIVNHVELLKFLREIKLTLGVKDLQILTKLFREKEKAVRQVESLTLQISDESDLNLAEVNTFLETLQLKRLSLVLTRDGLGGKQIEAFLNSLRILTSLSQLPLLELKVNFSGNTVTSGEAAALQKLFNEKCRNIKTRCLCC